MMSFYCNGMKGICTEMKTTRYCPMDCKFSDGTGGHHVDTNGDRIRAMTDEELADWFIMRDAIRKIDRDVFITGYSTPESILSRVNALTRIAWLNWLKQPAEVANDTD